VAVARVLAEPPDTAAVRWAQRLSLHPRLHRVGVLPRADSVGTAPQLLSRTLNGWETPSTLVTPTVVLWTRWGSRRSSLPANPLLIQAGWRMQPWVLGLLGAVMLFVIDLGPRGVAPFIYFQF
jgi:hypothetical protein